MTLDEIRERLQPFNCKKVAEVTGLKHATVWRLVSGKTTRPTWAVVERLQRFVETGK